jgi:MFS family permease
MTRLRLLVLMTFLESYATIIVERGLYFFTDQQLQFTVVMNLAVALSLGAAYVLGAMVSHRLAEPFGERRMIGLCIVGQLAVHLVMAIWPTTLSMFIGATLIGGLNGLKWPIVESYVGAGRDQWSMAKAVGRFNLAWASAVPLSLAATGPIIAIWPAGLFYLAAALNAVSLLLLKTFSPRPAHMPHDHPARPPRAQLDQWRRLLTSSRWSMLASYAMLFVLSPMMPEIFQRLGHPIIAATALAALLDVVRVVTFAVLQRWSGWHGRGWTLILVLVGLPISFLLIVLGQATAWVLLGEVVFGFLAGLTYYAALYYAIVIRNAAVDAGGAHEGLIGLGFFIGPLTGLFGAQLGAAIAWPGLGVALGYAPLALVCLAGAAWPLLRASGEQARPDPPSAGQP